MPKTLILDCPLTIDIPRKTKEPKKFRLNLNYFRNVHYQEYSKAKRLFKEIVEKLLKESNQDKIKFSGEVDVEMRLYKQSNRRSDKHNFLGANTKFFYDSLTELGVIPDDNDSIIKNETLLETVVDKANPRVSYKITERSN